MNVLAIASDGSLVYSGTRKGVELALGAIAGEAPSFARRADVAPLVRAAPADLVTALLVDGEMLIAPSEWELSPRARGRRRSSPTRG